MALVANPLFLQTGRYRAKEDRYLIGAFTHPAGAGESEVQEPLYGILPFTRGSAAGVNELSFMVAVSTQANAADSVRYLKIYRGAAIVPGLPNDGLEGSYLVVNDGSFDLTMSSVTGGTSYLIYIRVLDAEKDASAPVEGNSVKCSIAVIQDTGAASAPTSLHLLLARVTPIAGNPTGAAIEDLREFTTTHGGGLLVNDSTALTSNPKYDFATFGTMAHIGPQGKTMVRTKNGWEQLSTLSSGPSASVPPAADLSTGQFWFDSTLNVVYVKGTTELLPVRETRGEVKRGTGSYTGSRHQVYYSASPFIMEKGDSAAYADINTFTTISGPKPTTPDLQFVVKVTGDKTLVQATISFDVWVGNAAGAPIAGQFAAAWQILKGAGSTFTTPVTGYEFDNVYRATARYGLRAIQQFENTKSRTVFFSLPQGEYRLQPLFLSEQGAATDATLRYNLNHLTAEVVV